MPESLEYGVTSFVYRARRPFHPARFWDALHEEDVAWNGVLRSKGFFWLASRMDVTGSWSQAGSSAHYEPIGVWYATLPREEWPDDDATLAQLQKDWQEPWGDRRQELVFIGASMDEPALRRALDACLLSDIEMHQGVDAWSAMSDPFPAWVASLDEAI